MIGIRMPRPPGRLGRLVAERLAVLRRQFSAIVTETIERTTRSVGGAVGLAIGEVVRLSLRAAVSPTPEPTAPDRWEELHRHHTGFSPGVYSNDPYGHDAGGMDGFEADPWDDVPEHDERFHLVDRDDVAMPVSTPEPVAMPIPEPVPEPPKRGWWGRLLFSIVAVVTPTRLTRASVAAVMAVVVTLLPPSTAAVLGAATAALFA